MYKEKDYKWRIDAEEENMGVGGQTKGKRKYEEEKGEVETRICRKTIEQLRAMEKKMQKLRR